MNGPHPLSYSQDTPSSTSGSIQNFMGDRLVSWTSKVKSSDAISSTEAEYIALFRLFASNHGNLNSDQIALDDALVAPADRLKIGKCNLRLSSDVTSKEATLQVVYDVLKLTPFYKAFQVTADAPEIYMQEFWATAYVHNRSVRFKTNNKKHILNLDQFRDILQICPKVGNKKFEEPPLEKEILAFLASLGHSGEIRKITDVNVNKLHQPWRSFAAIINKCLSGKPSYDSLRLSQAQILWGMYNKKNVDYAYLLWEDFIFQIENKNTKKGNAMYYPRFTKLVVNFVMDKDPSIPRRNKVDDPMFTTINVISRNEDTQLYGTILPVALTNEDIRNSESYKEYYAIASGMIPPKTKGSKKKADTDTITKQKPPTVPKEVKEKKSGQGKQKAKQLETISEAMMTEAEQLKIITKRSRKETHSSHASGSGADEGTGVTPGVPDAPDYDSEDDISWKSSDDDQADDKNDDDENAQDDEDDEGQNVILPQVQATQEIEDTHVTLTPVNPDGQQQSSSVSSGFVSNMLNPNQDTGVDDIFRQHTEATSLIDSSCNSHHGEPILYGTKPITSNTVSLDSSEVAVQLKNNSLMLCANLSETRVKKILMDTMEAIQLLSTETCGDTVTIKRPRDGADDDQEPSAGTDRGSKRRRSGKEPASTSAPSETTTKTAGKTTTTGSKTHKQSASQSAPVLHDEQAKKVVQHLPDWFQQLIAIPSTDHAWNKSVPAAHESVQPWLSNLAQRQDPRESFDELTDNTFDFSAFVMNRLNVQTLTPELLAGPTFELMKGTCKSLTELEYFCEEVYKATTEKLDWINPEGRQYPHDLRQPLPLVPNSQGRHVIPFHHFINNDLEYLRGGESSRKYSTSVTKTTAADYGHIKWIEDLVPNSMWSQMIVKYDKFALWGISHWGKKRRQFYAFATSRESARDVYSKRRIIAVTKVEIVEWQNYKHLDWITVRRDDDGKVTNLNVEERIAFNVSLRMFTRRVVIQRRVEDLQLGVESYQKKLNLTKPDTYRSNLRRQDAYTPYSDPRGFIYENKDKKNRLMRHWTRNLHKLEFIHNEDGNSLLESTSKQAMVDSLLQLEILSKKILLKLNLSDHSVEVLKLKNFKKDATLKLSKIGMSMSVQKSQVHKMAKFQDGKEIVLG
ncbi:hypothetical protein Tco_1081333 [Tanacetum coccineum]|uniref:Uncharacterized protein n=1 Tax=Tanacetum coccineum TaxID=301880 RepID=A0ABQ5HXA6_9ASTR